MSQEAEAVRSWGFPPGGTADEKLLRSQSTANRHLYHKRLVDAVEAQQEMQQSTSYQQYDGETGLARLRSSDGSVVYGQAQTNGAIGKGETIRLRRGGVVSGYDAMPRRRIITEETVIQKVKVPVILTFIDFDSFTGYTNSSSSRLIFEVKTDTNSATITYSYSSNLVNTTVDIAIATIFSVSTFSRNFRVSFEADFQTTPGGLTYSAVGINQQPQQQTSGGFVDGTYDYEIDGGELEYSQSVPKGNNFVVHSFYWRDIYAPSTPGVNVTGTVKAKTS